MRRGLARHIEHKRGAHPCGGDLFAPAIWILRTFRNFSEPSAPANQHRPLRIAASQALRGDKASDASFRCASRPISDVLPEIGGDRKLLFSLAFVSTGQWVVGQF